MDPYAIFLQVRSAVTSAAYPRQIDYTIFVRGLDGATPKVNHYRATADTSDGEIRVFPISDEELAAPPPVPHGFNFGITSDICEQRCETGSWHYKAPVGPAPSAFDLLGMPMIAPTYAFGLKYPPAFAQTAGGNEPEPLPVIAVVSTKTRDYDVTLVDTPEVDGVSTYHLRLKPLRKPKDNRLRELWAGMQDYLPRKAIVSGNFTIAPLVDVPWTIRFTVSDGIPYVVDETASATLYLAHRHVVRNATIGFENVREPDGSIAHRPLVAPEVTDSTLVEP